MTNAWITASCTLRKSALLNFSFAQAGHRGTAYAHYTSLLCFACFALFRSQWWVLISYNLFKDDDRSLQSVCRDCWCLPSRSNQHACVGWLWSASCINFMDEEVWQTPTMITRKRWSRNGSDQYLQMQSSHSKHLAVSRTIEVVKIKVTFDL